MKERACVNCIHYSRHYIKIDGKFKPIDCGHCRNSVHGKFRKTDKPCDSYEERNDEKEKEERTKSATEHLAYISKQIDYLKEMLKD